MSAFKIAAFVFTTIICSNSFGQQSSADSTAILVQKMAAHNIYELSSSVGFTGKLSTQYQLFERLAVIATNERLLDYATHHLNPVARLYCYQVLRKRNVAIPTALVQQMKKDKSIIMTMLGCMADKTTLGSLADRDVFYSYSKK